MITIVNYGVGNINAVASAIRQAGSEVIIATSKEQLINAKKLILPGVGSFGNAIRSLENSGMRDALEKMVIDKKTPILGICVGMQILASSSDESQLRGLSWIDAHVLKLEDNGQEKLILPHMGYNKVDRSVDVCPLLANLTQAPSFYFLHSYYVHCNQTTDILAETTYQTKFSSIINYENIYGVQFHPEKSHSNGIELFRNFIKV